MTATTDNLTQLDIEAWYEERHQIAIVWSIDDVQDLRPDLDDERAFEVLLACRDAHDAEIGFTWTLISEVAEEMFPRKG